MWKLTCRLMCAPALIIAGGAVPGSAAQATGTCNPSAVIEYDHFTENTSKAYPAQHVEPGDEIEVVISNTCPSAFEFASVPVSAAHPPAPAAGVAATCTLEKVTICIVHEDRFGSYLVEVTSSGADATATHGGTTKTLSAVTLVIPVHHNPWRLDFGSGFTISDLTDPVFAVDEQTVEGEETSILIRNRSAEDHKNLGIAAFTHVYHERFKLGRWGHWGMSLGLGIDERNEASYYTGLSWLWGDKGALTLGYQWGSVKRLPGQLAEGDVVDEPNSLAELPSRIDGAWFFGLSYSFLGGRDRFEKVVAKAGQRGGPATETKSEQKSDSAPADDSGGSQGGSATGGKPVPPKVENLKISRSGAANALEWDAVTDAGYLVVRGTECKPELLFTLTTANIKDASYEDTPNDSTVAYFYAVQAVRNGVAGDWSDCVRAPVTQ